MKRLVVVVALLAAGCGDAGAATSAAPTTTTPATIVSTTTTMPAPTTLAGTGEPLTTYAFSMTLSVEAADGTVRTVSQLAGQGTVAAGPVVIRGEAGSDSIDLASDGTSWWDAAAPDTLVEAADVDAFLAATGFLQPAAIAPLLEAADAWETVATGPRHGVETTHIRRTGIVKDVDWAYGDVASLDVWLDPDGIVVELEAHWATGDNAGFPISSWAITERNIDVAIPSRPAD